MRNPDGRVLGRETVRHWQAAARDPLRRNRLPGNVLGRDCLSGDVLGRDRLGRGARPTEAGAGNGRCREMSRWQCRSRKMNGCQTNCWQADGRPTELLTPRTSRRGNAGRPWPNGGRSWHRRGHCLCLGHCHGLGRRDRLGRNRTARRRGPTTPAQPKSQPNCGPERTEREPTRQRDPPLGDERGSRGSHRSAPHDHRPPSPASSSTASNAPVRDSAVASARPGCLAAS